MIQVRVYRADEKLSAEDQEVFDRVSEECRQVSWRFLIFGDSSTMVNACARELAFPGAQWCITPFESVTHVYGVEEREVSWTDEI